MVVLDGYKSHLSIQFELFYKEKNIITLYLPAHSSHLTQPLDVGCFIILKWIYSHELETFIKAYIYYIIKTEFLLIFKTTHFKAMIPINA